MKPISVGILFYRIQKKQLEVLLVHPGGPFGKNKDVGAWSIPKGEIEEGEEPILAAQREVEEKLGIPVSGRWLPIHPVKQKSGKLVYAWAVRQDIDIDEIHSNSFQMEWPPKSGKKRSFPEVDAAQWLGIKEAKEKILLAQVSFITELEELLVDSLG